MPGFTTQGYLDEFLDRADREIQVKTEWTRTFREMIVHTRGIFPKLLLNNTRPNESPEIKEYREENYEPITQDGVIKALDRLSRIFSNSNFKIKASEDMEEYLSEKKFDVLEFGGVNDRVSFEQLMFSIVLKTDIEDPNGFLVWMPVNSVDAMLPPSENPADKKIEVEPKIVWSRDVIDYTDNVFSYHAGELKYDKDQPPAPWYMVITEEEIYKVIPVRRDANTGKVVYKFELWYLLGEDQNAFPFVPAILLKGERVADGENNFYFQSFFQSYVAAGNEAIRSFSDNQAVAVQANYPVKAMKGQQCWECKGSGHYFEGNGDERKRITCGSCKGTGITGALSPHSSFIKMPPVNAEDPSFALSPVVEWYSPDTSIIDSSTNRWVDLLDRAERSINVKFIEESQSGVAKDKDLEQLMDMLAKISKNMFRIVEESLISIQAYREPIASNRKDIVVVQPTDFRIKSKKELTEELTNAIKNGLPSAFVFTAAENLSREIYNGDEVAQKMVKIEAMYNPFYGKTIDEVMKLNALGEVTALDKVKFTKSFAILMKVKDDMGERFLDASFEEIETAADIIAQSMITEITPLTNELGLPI